MWFYDTIIWGLTVWLFLLSPALVLYIILIIKKNFEGLKYFTIWLLIIFFIQHFMFKTIYIEEYNIKNVENKRIEIENIIKTKNKENLKYIINNKINIDYNSTKFLVGEKDLSYRFNNLFKDYLLPLNFKDYFYKDIYKKWWVENFKKYLIEECKKSKDLYENVKYNFDNSFLFKLEEFKKITDNTCYNLWIDTDYL